MPCPASQFATAWARRPSSEKVSGTSWWMNAGLSPQRRTAARRIDPTGTRGYSSDRGSPGGQLATEPVRACVAVILVLSSGCLPQRSVAQFTDHVEDGRLGG